MAFDKNEKILHSVVFCISVNLINTEPLITTMGANEQWLGGAELM